MNPSLGTWIFTSWHMAWYQWIMDVGVYLNVAFENIQQLSCYEWFIHVCYFLIYRGVMKPYGFIMSTKYYWHVMDGLALLLWSNLKGINTSTYPREYSFRYKRLLTSGGVNKSDTNVRYANVLTHWGSRQKGRHFSDDIFKRIFLNENVRISVEIALNFVPYGPIDYKSALVQIMAWRRIRLQAIILTYDGLVHWLIHAFLGLNKLSITALASLILLYVVSGQSDVTYDRWAKR